MSDSLPLVPTSSDFGEQHEVQTGSRNCTQTGSINNLTTETDIDVILVTIPMFWGKFFTSVYAALTRRFLHPEIPIWRTYTGSSYNFVTEKYQGDLSC